jgi:hypothetical protein
MGQYRALLEKVLFWEFSHLDKVCFEAYLQLLSIHILRITQSSSDNAPAHNWTHLNYQTNVILLFQLAAVRPEVNPTERVWEYLKVFLAWSGFSNLAETPQKSTGDKFGIFKRCRVNCFITGWSSGIFTILSLSPS